MTTEEIQKVCLYDYKEALENLPEDFDDALEYSEDRSMDDGICFYAHWVLLEKIRDKEWIKDNKDIDDYWTTPPVECESIEEIRESLQYRINKLQELLGTYN